MRDQQIVEKVLKELEKGADFRALAKQYSTCPSKKKGGDLGWFKPRTMVQPFENAVKKLAVGETSGPVRTEFGTHIIQKTGQR